MITAAGELPNGTRGIVIAITYGELIMLSEGGAIDIDLSKFGLEARALLLAGESNEELQKQLAPVMNENTKVVHEVATMFSVNGDDEGEVKQ